MHEFFPSSPGVFDVAAAAADAGAIAAEAIDVTPLCQYGDFTDFPYKYLLYKKQLRTGPYK